MIKGSVSGGDRVVGSLNAFPEVIKAGLTRGIGRAVLRVLRRVKESKLSGQVLNVVTGRLRRSVTQRVEQEGSNVVGYVGTKVKYARAHEYGFNGVVTVREHLRQAVSGFKATVMAHTRNVHLPERSFLRSALADLRSEVNGDIRDGVAEAIRGRA